jgi:hypothetical protein
MLVRDRSRILSITPSFPLNLRGMKGGYPESGNDKMGNGFQTSWNDIYSDIKLKKVGSNRVDIVSQSRNWEMLSSFNASNHLAATLEYVSQLLSTIVTW